MSGSRFIDGNKADYTEVYEDEADQRRCRGKEEEQARVVRRNRAEKAELSEDRIAQRPFVDPQDVSAIQ